MLGKVDEATFMQPSTTGNYQVIGKLLGDFKALCNLADATGKARPLSLGNRNVAEMSAGAVAALDTMGMVPATELYTKVEVNKHFPLHKVTEFLGILDARARVHKQVPGQMFAFHVDDLKGLRRDQETGASPVQATEKDFIRLQVAMSPMMFGHIYMFGYEQWMWEVGEVIWFDWKNMAHGTANLSDTPRYTFQITGIATQQTWDIIKSQEPFTLEI